MTGSGGGLVGWAGEKKGFCCRSSLGPLYVVLLRQETLAGRPRPFHHAPAAVVQLAASGPQVPDGRSRVVSQPRRCLLGSASSTNFP
jgi:hypothetical protein